MRVIVTSLLVGLSHAVVSAHPAAGQSLDTARALGALRDAATACRTDAGRLWGRSLCGPIVLVDRDTRLAIANDTVAQRRFLPLAGAFVTTLPSSQYVANTSFTWGGREWTMVILPLPPDRFARTALVMHEVFHREQGALGLRQTDALNNQLDMRAGRSWLRLEYHALAAALDALPRDRALARHHALSAMLFRAYRRSLYPGSDSLEATLEIQEGLPEYTGERLALDLTGNGPPRAARALRDFERSTPTFVRAFAYGTGPALGLLLDAFAPNWRSAITTHRDPGALLAAAVGFHAPSALAAAARAAAPEYGWEAVDAEEARRDSARAPAMRDYRARLADGPTITMRQTKDSLQWGYDPTTLVGFDLESAVYPWGSFTAPWGALNVERGGVLVQNGFAWIRVPVPSTVPPPGATQIVGDGWTLTLNPRWQLQADPGRAGSFLVVPSAAAR
jgi:hypothetical protein